MHGQDADLVERARTGDTRAFATLVQRYLGACHALALGIVRDEAEADDVCQDAFIAAARDLDRCDPERFAGWLFRIVRNRALSELRRTRVRGAVPLESAAELAGESDPSRDAERSELRRALTAALDTLPPRQREVLLLHDLEGWKHREIAAALEIAEGTVRYTLHEARAAMRRRLTAT